jgi:hypothetical protein
MTVNIISVRMEHNTWQPVETIHPHLLKRCRSSTNGFEFYLTATGIEEKAEKVQVATFLHVAGPDAQRVYNTFDIVADDREKIKVRLQTTLFIRVRGQ